MKFFLLLVALLSLGVVRAQDVSFQFKGVITNLDKGASEAGVTVQLLKDGAVIQTTQSASNGKYNLVSTGPATAQYTVLFSKPGFVAKKITISVAGVNVEMLPAGNTVPFPPLDIDLFAERPDLDFSFLKNEPVADFAWDDKKGVVDFDRVASAKTRKKIEDLLNKAEAQAAQNEANYQKAIQQADAFYTQKNYEAALEKYEEALTYKPKEPHPAARIVELDALIKAKKEQELAEAQLNGEYNNLIKAADNLRDQGQLENAVTKYKEAIAKKNEQYPKDQVAALTIKIEQQKKEAANQAAYDAAIQKGDMFFKQNSLKAAKDKYTEASTLKPSEEYPKKKIKEIEDKLKAQEAQDAKRKEYDELIAAADVLFNSSDFAQAKTKYDAALVIEASSSYAKERSTLCAQKIAAAEAEAKKKEQIIALMKAGDQAMVAKDYGGAKIKFEEVLKLDSANEEAKNKLDQANQKLKEEADQALKMKEHDALVAAGDKALVAKTYQEAISKYEAALAIKTSPEVNQKLADARTKLEAQKNAEANKALYDKTMAEAQALLTSGDLTGAKTKFEAASALDPAQQLPKTKLAEIDKKLAEQAALAAKTEKINAAIKEGDHHFELAKWEEAKARYREALSLDPNQAYAKQRVVDIDKKIADEKAKAEMESKLNLTLAEADKLYAESKWNEAKKKYAELILLSPTNTHAKQRIVEIDQKLEELAKAADKQAKIDKALNDGQLLLTQKKYEPAKLKFEEVLLLDPANAKATQAINEINNALAAMKSEAEKNAAFAQLKSEGMNLFGQQKYAEAKSKLQEALSLKDDPEVKAKILEADKLIAQNQKSAELEETYNKAIAAAQSLESSNDWQGALGKYQEASTLKPAELLPKNKIKEIQQKLQANAELMKAEQAYTDAMSKAEALRSKGDYPAAKTSYQLASTLKPAESLPKQRIQEMDELIKASAEESQINKQYLEWMTKGKALMAEEKYLDAIQSFNQANKLKPSEKEPVDLAKQAEMLEKAKGDEIEQEYQKILTVAEKKMNEGEYDRAIELVNRAKGLRPGDSRPGELLTQINQLKKIDADYKELMKKASTAEVSKSYAEAKGLYEQASTKKPAEQLPKDKISEMDRLMSAQSATVNTDNRYAEHMTKGSEYFSAKSYEQALSEYNKALVVKANDIAAQAKITEIERILADIEKAKAEDIGRKIAFDKLVKEADDLFTKKEWLKAKGVYESAQRIDPSSSYVAMQIDECIKQERNKGNSEAEREYQKIIKAGDKHFNLASYEKAKEYYQRALSFKSDDPYPKQKLAEIEGILNPVVLNSEKLLPLGEPFDNSIMDGQALLEKAEAERKLLKGGQVKEQFDEIQNDASNRTNEKQENSYAASNEIYLVKQRVSDDEAYADLGRQATLDALTRSKVELDELEKGNFHYEYNANLYDQSNLYVINDQVSLKYGEDIMRYSDNADELKRYQTAHADRVKQTELEDHKSHHDADGELTGVKIKVEQDVRDDIKDREESNEILRAIQVVEQMNTTEREEAKKLSLLDNQQEVSRIEGSYSDRQLEGERLAQENHGGMKEVQGNVVLSDTERNLQKEAHLLKTDGELHEVKVRISEDDIDREGMRSMNAERLKQESSELQIAEMEKYNAEKGKQIQNKANIHDQVQVNGEIALLEKELQDSKVAYIEGVDKRATINNAEITLSDEEERLSAKKDVEGVYSNIQSTTKLEEDKIKEKGTQMDDVTRTISAEGHNSAIGQQEKHYDAASQLSDVSDTPKPKVKVANALGQEYPEGVTQENFTNKDKNGLMTSIVTRRIVVIDGQADVYVRTQSLNATTYTKNGNPSLEHVWNKETQGPHLQRHY